MKVTIVGNCQAYGLANAMNALHCEVQATSHTYTGPAELQSIAAGADILVLQNTIAEDIRRDVSVSRKVVVWPSVHFNAFHPDITYAHANSKWLQSGLGDYNSTIVIYGWLNKLSAEQIVSLFREEVYEALGFLDCWEAAADQLLITARNTDVPLDDLLLKFKEIGCFMHSLNHPVLMVLGHIAHRVLRCLGFSVAEKQVELIRYMHDNLTGGPVWPVYPELAARLKVPGSTLFKRPHPPTPDANQLILTLEEFVEASLDSYGDYDVSTLNCPRVQTPLYSELGRFIKRGGRTPHPYAGLPDRQFWRKAVTNVSRQDMDPAVPYNFRIEANTKVSTAGSCFAQHISNRLSLNGFNHFVAEPGPANLTQDEVVLRGFGVFSARYGNVYTSRQLKQLFERAYGYFTPRDIAWQRPDGRYVDPFRPQIEPEGYASPSEVAAAANEHLFSVRHMFESLDVFIFTLGLTETWSSKIDGAVYPLAPGVVAGQMSPEMYTFVNLTKEEVVQDLISFISMLHAVNPNARLILTVSPVPLAATYEPTHVLVATTYSKSVLRVAAQEIAAQYACVEYFPSYEIITGNYNRGTYFERDLRTITAEGVDHVMKIFMRHFTKVESGDTKVSGPQDLFKVFCDEDSIADI